jgi:hypothetical protein
MFSLLGMSDGGSIKTLPSENRLFMAVSENTRASSQAADSKQYGKAKSTRRGDFREPQRLTPPRA